jgi:hypothetical protein
MEQLLKLNKKIHIIIFFLFVIIINIVTGCKALYSSINTNESLKIGDITNMSGYLIYDGKKGVANFLEMGSINFEKLSKRDISKLICNSTNIILLRKGLENYRDSELLSLTLCNKDQRLIVKNSELLFSRFYIVRLENFLFYRVNRKYKDLKQRLLFCKKE